MKQILLAISMTAMFTSGLFASGGEGIQFFQGTWEEAKAKAKAENKIIFVDAYAVWCGPCKWMDVHVFSDERVGAFFNEHFISYKFDMEKGEGPDFARTYAVRGYPTLLFVAGDGKEVHRTMGSRSIETLIELGEEALKK
jgi:thiol:disulfide interchange protein